MCRVLGYLGEPLPLESILYSSDASLIRQVHDPKMMATFLNLAGFGMVAWDPASRDSDEPFVYRVTHLPTYDQNLRRLARKLAPSCVLAHVRGVTWAPDEVLSPQNLHPFRFAGVPTVLAHNGHLREFRSMRFDLVPHVRPEFAAQVSGTTDSEWLYALLLSHLDDPYGLPGADELADATMRTLALVRDIRVRRGIETSSPVNLFITTGECFVATRFSYDYGWYPEDDGMLEIDLPYVSLWYTLGDSFVERDGDWLMEGAGEAPRSIIISSEPLVTDTSTWLEAPEYSIITVGREGGAIRIQTHDLLV